MNDMERAFEKASEEAGITNSEINNKYEVNENESVNSQEPDVEYTDDYESDMEESEENDVNISTLFLPKKACLVCKLFNTVGRVTFSKSGKLITKKLDDLECNLEGKERCPATSLIISYGDPVTLVEKYINAEIEMNVDELKRIQDKLSTYDDLATEYFFQLLQIRRKEIQEQQEQH